jgi:hypothetical protein
MSDFQNQHVSEAKLAQRRRRLARWQTAILGARLPMRRAAPAPKRRFGSKHGSGNANAVPRSGEEKPPHAVAVEQQLLNLWPMGHSQPQTARPRPLNVVF